MRERRGIEAFLWESAAAVIFSLIFFFTNGCFSLVDVAIHESVCLWYWHAGGAAEESWHYYCRGLLQNIL